MGVALYLVLVDGVNTQCVEGVALRRLAAQLPLLLLLAREIVGLVDVSWIPLSVDLLLVARADGRILDFPMRVGVFGDALGELLGQRPASVGGLRGLALGRLR